MKVNHVVVLILALLALVACVPQMATPTPKPEPTAATGDSSTPAAGESITSTQPITPAGGVDVALAAIEPVTGTLATVNGEEIIWTDYEPELNQALHSITLQYGLDWNEEANLALLGTFQDQVLQTLIDRVVLRQGAAKEGIEATEADIEAEIEEQKAGVLDSGRVSSWDQFLEQYGFTDEYFARVMEDAVLVDLVSEAHAPSREAEQVHARHILVADEETGKQVLSRLEAGEDWEALASELSQDTSNKDNAGDLGWFPRGAMVAEFEEVAFSLEPGKTSDLVQTDFGFHIIQVLEKDVREVDDQNYEGMLSQAFQTWFEEQKAAADTSIQVTFASGN